MLINIKIKLHVDTNNSHVHKFGGGGINMPPYKIKHFITGK